MQAIKVTFFSATNCKSSRIKATADSVSITRDYDYSRDIKDQVLDLALELANSKLRWSVKKFAIGSFKESYYCIAV